ncbi:MAG: hypothetical protein HKN76_04270 [Saprospiraceae bacterium]|nr:hypothetical protein [Saprospiraceae bacterium]
MKEKIKALFDYRRIPWLLDFSTFPDKEAFMTQLVALQYAIYELDLFLESNWAINEKMLEDYWKEIYRLLLQMNLKNDELPSWVHEIKIYQARELALRDQISPVKHDIENLYHHKSCDVRLIRRLIYRLDPRIEDTIPFLDWTEFDLLTEVNDDLEDLIEDMSTLNGNRFLFTIYEKGSAETERVYHQFILDKMEKANKRFAQALGARRHLFKVISRIGEDTQKLLKERLSELNLEKLQSSKVILAYEPR